MNDSKFLEAMVVLNIFMFFIILTKEDSQRVFTVILVTLTVFPKNHRPGKIPDGWSQRQGRGPASFFSQD